MAWALSAGLLLGRPFKSSEDFFAPILTLLIAFAFSGVILMGGADIGYEVRSRARIFVAGAIAASLIVALIVILYAELALMCAHTMCAG